MIPLNSGESTIVYAIKKYVYTTLFDILRLTYVTHNGENDLIHVWHDVLVQLQIQLRKQGSVCPKQAAVVFVQNYKVSYQSTDKLQVSFLDVINTISNSTSYLSHLERKIIICHTIMHAIL